MKTKTENELLSILKKAKKPLTTQEIMKKFFEKCPEASMNMIVSLKESGVIVSEWASGKGYVWMLPS